jgi:hypothetical protein
VAPNIAMCGGASEALGAASVEAATDVSYSHRARALHTERHDEETKPTMERDELVRHDHPPNQCPSGSSRRITSSEDDRRRSKDDIVKSD